MLQARHIVSTVFSLFYNKSWTKLVHIAVTIGNSRDITVLFVLSRCWLLSYNVGCPNTCATYGCVIL